ncbi:hypothetical protein PRIPAC_74140 [Pristionchus pacificus]|uniref:C-type lectin n=1 Tax=Pristionchus pacificus TaxID=54126 RepID=A0A2A6C525_PRIPA|nr:hypothetical protein PRIPAC_74140 [Pristionchus pacificus]|eukprot:PDM73217.1 C-type lectin [Pristionchus pacificus]
MGNFWQVQALITLLLIARYIDASVYSCEELRYKLINTTFTQNTNYACIITQEGFTHWNQLEKVYAQVDKYYTSFHDIATGAGSCIENVRMEHPWDFFADSGVVLDCSQEFTLILTSDKPTSSASACTADTCSPCPKQACGCTRGDVWDREPCDALPDWLFSFDNVITIDSDHSVEMTVECSSVLELDAMTMVLPGDRIAILTSGRSDDLQNMEGSDKAAFVLIGEWESHDVTVDMQLSFDPTNTGSIVLQKSWGGPEFKYYNGSHTEKFTTSFFEIHYAPKLKQPSEIWNSQDNIVIEIAIDSKAPSTEPTAAPPNKDPYCDCSVDASGAPVGWSYRGIWLDIVIVIDVSEAMGQESIDRASTLTESLVSTLVTDTTAPLYTRVGVIAMGTDAKVLYNLNMTKADKVKATVDNGVREINIVYAFEAAQGMFSDGLTSKPDRANARQVIYFMTDSDYKNDVNSINAFKDASGVIVVSNFLKNGEIEKSELNHLASLGYFFSDNTSNTALLQAFCKANCYCQSDKIPFGGSDPALKAAGGCYKPAPDERDPFSKAKSACSINGGMLATIHDDEKNHFVQKIMESSKSDFFWIGYSKSDDGAWHWDDESTDPYTNWAVDEPSTAAVSNCAYVDTTSSVLTWGAGNCQIGFPYACEYEPCSVGSMDC